MSYFFYGKIVAGRLQILELKKVSEEIRKLEFEGLVKVTVDAVDQRSPEMNGYFHSVIVPGFRHALVSAGYRIYDDVNCKKIIKKLFLTRYVQIEPGKVCEKEINTSELSNEEFRALVEEIIQFAAEHLYYMIPFPNEVQSDARFNFLTNKK